MGLLTIVGLRLSTHESSHIRRLCQSLHVMLLWHPYHRHITVSLIRLHHSLSLLECLHIVSLQRGLHLLNSLIHRLCWLHVHSLAHWLLHILCLSLESVHCTFIECTVRGLLLLGTLLVWIAQCHILETWIGFPRCHGTVVVRLLVHHVEVLCLAS